MGFEDFEETEQIRNQLASKISKLQHDIKNAEPQLIPYLKEKLDLLENEWNTLGESLGDDREYVPAQDFSSS